MAQLKFVLLLTFGDLSGQSYICFIICNVHHTQNLHAPNNSKRLHSQTILEFVGTLM